MTRQHPPLPRREIQALGIRTSYYETGRSEGPPAVLLHGMSTSGDSFREVMWLLADEYRLIAPDIPGFGYSAHTSPYTLVHLGEWFASFLAVLGLSEVHLVGHSFGGVVATAFTLAYPEEVRSLALIAPALLKAQEFPDWVRNLANPTLLDKVTNATFAVTRRTILSRQVRAPFYNPARMPESVWERREQDYHNARASGSVLSAVATEDLAGRLDRVSAPVCLIWGKDDRVVTPEHAPILARQLPHVCGVHMLDECGHTPVVEKPARVAEILRRLWETDYRIG